ncbi:FkbM family methyltransferase [Phragmitibacter flavus]|uniref:FkbM family methyltransferase n=1 Tax=Phragmitibacter flavus TaxID=2576071 RepID=A0A5R8KF28_9BACT|nr:FkbM family methyltransferase [Phragmitibacter flavus]TLD70903.1 FkbM family methyltransferase [Phragmitibacter flavus]
MGLFRLFKNFKHIAANPGCSTARSLIRHSLWHMVKRAAPLPLKVRLTERSELSINHRAEMNGCVALAWSQRLYDYHNMSFLLDVTGHSTFCRTGLDIGANIGIYSLLMSESREVQMHAFEPHPATFQALQKILDYNHRPNVKAWNFALSDKDGSVSFSNADFNPTNRIVSEAGKGQTTTEVMALRGDDWCQRENVQPDIIKIDTEGHEAIVLQGLADALRTTKLVLVEENVSLDGTLLSPEAGIFDGPWYVDFPQRKFVTRKHAPEDAVYLNKNAHSELNALGYSLPKVSC